jgi:hypothetical protein
MDFISAYINYNRETEPPYIYHRWAAISTISALLGRTYYVQLGPFRVFPNLYCMFIGEPAARKSTAIKIAKKLVRASGYSHFGADTTSKEQFLIDLDGSHSEFGEADKKVGTEAYDRKLEENLWGDNPAFLEPKEVYVCHDEFSDWCGASPIGLFTTLGNLWDWDDEEPFSQRFKNSKAVSIYQPTVSILGGIAPELFARTFPPEIIGTGFFSRLLLIYGERSSRKYSVPPKPSDSAKQSIIERMMRLRPPAVTELTFSEEADAMRDTLYNNWIELEDLRFRSYNNRRYTQLLKLCIIVAVSHGKEVIDAACIVEANTYLAAAEALMPKAVGEFGKSKQSEIAHRVLEALNNSRRPLKFQELWTLVHRDLDKQEQLVEIIKGLANAGKMQTAKFTGGSGYIPLNKVKEKPILVDWSLLTEEERNML